MKPSTEKKADESWRIGDEEQAQDKSKGGSSDVESVKKQDRATITEQKEKADESLRATDEEQAQDKAKGGSSVVESVMKQDDRTIMEKFGDEVEKKSSDKMASLIEQFNRKFEEQERSASKKFEEQERSAREAFEKATNKLEQAHIQSVKAYEEQERSAREAFTIATDKFEQAHIQSVKAYEQAIDTLKKAKEQDSVVKEALEIAKAANKTCQELLNAQRLTEDENKVKIITVDTKFELRKLLSKADMDQFKEFDKTRIALGNSRRMLEEHVNRIIISMWTKIAVSSTLYLPITALACNVSCLSCYEAGAFGLLLSVLYVVWLFSAINAARVDENSLKAKVTKYVERATLFEEDVNTFNERVLNSLPIVAYSATSNPNDFREKMKTYVKNRLTTLNVVEFESADFLSACESSISKAQFTNCVIVAIITFGLGLRFCWLEKIECMTKETSKNDTGIIKPVASS